VVDEKMFGSHARGVAVVISLRLRSFARIRRMRESKAKSTLAIATTFSMIVLGASLLQPYLPSIPPDQQDLTSVLQAPSWSHPFGTDNLGRDLLSRTVAAARLDLGVALSVTLISMALGVLLGAVAGLFGNPMEAVIMRVVDAVLAFPFLIFIITVIAIVGTGLKGVLIGVPLNGWALYARVTRGEMLRVREQEYILAARTLGYSRLRIIMRHALPNAWRPAIVLSMADVVMNILLLASLSYLGLGVQPPAAEWGSIIADGQQYLLQAWWFSTLPGLVLVAVGAAFCIMGDAVADLLGEDPRVVA